MKILYLVAASVGLSLAAASVPGRATASQLSYYPITPQFGGNPNNYAPLLGLAQIQNMHSSGGSGSSGGTPQINFPPITIDLGGLGGTAPTTTPAGSTAGTTTGN